MSLPSDVSSASTPARAPMVAVKSTVSTSSLAACPARSLPGQRQIIGIRVIASEQIPGAFSMMPCSAA
jgi:hypothetical protein